MIKIYGKPNCAECDIAKNILANSNVEYEYINIMETPAAMQMFREKGFRAVPQIFNGDTHLGGVNELNAFLKTL